MSAWLVAVLGGLLVLEAMAALAWLSAAPRAGRGYWPFALWLSLSTATELSKFVLACYERPTMSLSVAYSSASSILLLGILHGWGAGFYSLAGGLILIGSILANLCGVIPPPMTVALCSLAVLPAIMRVIAVSRATTTGTLSLSARGKMALATFFIFGPSVVCYPWFSSLHAYHDLALAFWTARMIFIALGYAIMIGVALSFHRLSYD